MTVRQEVEKTMLQHQAAEDYSAIVVKLDKLYRRMDKATLDKWLAETTIGDLEAFIGTAEADYKKLMNPAPTVLSEKE